MRRITLLGLALLSLLALLPEARAYSIHSWWEDGEDIVMDNVFLPQDPWAAPAEWQMSEWNTIDTTDNSHPFRVNVDPEWEFEADDGDNTIGFLDEAGLNDAYDLSFVDALAWTIPFADGDGRYVECDIAVDNSRPWLLGPDDENYFQSTVLHELGHCRALNHYNSYLSMMNVNTPGHPVSKYLRGEALYMDDKEAIRRHASHVSELDMVVYNKWHDGTVPQWMTMDPIDLREHEAVHLSGITVENRGTDGVPGELRLGVYVSPDQAITPSDALAGTAYWASFNRFTYSTIDMDVEIPDVDDCGRYYLGAIIDDTGTYPERYENNNAVVLTNGLPYTGTTFTPTRVTIGLAEDALEPNDEGATATQIPPGYSNGNLSIDEDLATDWFTFSLSCGKYVEVVATFTHDKGDLALRLRDQNDTLLETSDHSSPSHNGEEIHSDLPAGSYRVIVSGVGAGSCNRYGLYVASKDVTPPSGEITAPANGACSGAPVTIADSYADECDAGLHRIYDPAPGPTYSTHGDHHVTLTVEDDEDNTAEDSVSFTIDTVAPQVAILQPPVGVPLLLPMKISFTSSDADGASGGVIHEAIRLEECVIYDGTTFGDADGLLNDEEIWLSQATLCAAAQACGITQLSQPVLRVEASDCGGNVGVARRTLNGNISLTQLCAF